MGDCTIRISFAPVFVPDDFHANGESSRSTDREDNSKVTVTRTYSADSTVREVVEKNGLLWSLLQSETKLTLWDCTCHPVVDITAWPMDEFSEQVGPRSKTLKDAGWFPSGNLLVLPPGMTPSVFAKADYDDAQYNKQALISSSNEATEEKKIQQRLLKLNQVDDGGNVSRPLPSQVMQSVASRFDNDAAKQQFDEALEAREVLQKNKVERQAVMDERNTKLDQRIKKLEAQLSSSDKNKKVSKQVRNMLIKSRATGDSKLKLQDRRYFTCILLDESQEAKQEFRFFSPQDTFSRVAASVKDHSKLEFSEVLVNKEVHGSLQYWRLPMTMRLYEAATEKFVEQLQDSLIIHWYASRGDMSPSIVTTNVDAGENISTVALEETTETKVEDSIPSASTVQSLPQMDDCWEDTALLEILRVLDEASAKGKAKKKKSSASAKVRQMQIKSKAKGDGKRIPQMENRFFLEVVLVDNRAPNHVPLFCFMARTDPVARVLQVVTPSTTSDQWDFVVPCETKFRSLTDTSWSFARTQEEGVLEPFGRLILRRKQIS